MAQRTTAVPCWPLQIKPADLHLSPLLPEGTQGHFEERLQDVKKEDTSSVESNRGDMKRKPIKKKRP